MYVLVTLYYFNISSKKKRDTCSILKRIVQISTSISDEKATWDKNVLFWKIKNKNTIDLLCFLPVLIELHLYIFTY